MSNFLNAAFMAGSSSPTTMGNWPCERGIGKIISKSVCGIRRQEI